MSAPLYQYHTEHHDRPANGAGWILASVHFNPQHAIYRGHFPDFPLTPGACQLGLVREVLEDCLGRELILQRARNIKFYKMHVPADVPVLMLEINYMLREGEIQVEAVLKDGEGVYFKMKGSYLGR